MLKALKQFPEKVLNLIDLVIGCEPFTNCLAVQNMYAYTMCITHRDIYIYKTYTIHMSSYTTVSVYNIMKCLEKIEVQHH